jgi:hypothetical protein
VRTRHLRLITSEHSVTTTNRESVLSPYGPVRAGLTTSQTTNDQGLTELLNSLEKKIADLNTKSCTVLDTWSTVTQEVSAVLSSTQTEGAGTDADRC